jgi:hypothetical protein
VTALAPEWRRAGLTISLLGLVLAMLAALVVFGSGTAFAADRDPIFFQPVTAAGNTFTAVGTGQFATTYPKGVVDDGKTLTRSKVVAANFTKTYQWGSNGTPGGMVIKNISKMLICQITIGILDNTTFPKDTTVYKAPSGWTVTVSADQKTLTFAAVKNPDDCVAKDGWFWMQVPASPLPTEPGGATLEGKLALADGGSDADAVTYIEPDTATTSTSTVTSTATDTDSPTSSPTSTFSPPPTGTASPTAPVTSSTSPAPPTDSALPSAPVTSTAGPPASSPPPL